MADENDELPVAIKIFVVLAFLGGAGYIASNWRDWFIMVGMVLVAVAWRERDAREGRL